MLLVHEGHGRGIRPHVFRGRLFQLPAGECQSLLREVEGLDPTSLADCDELVAVRGECYSSRVLSRVFGFEGAGRHQKRHEPATEATFLATGRDKPLPVGREDEPVHGALVSLDRRDVLPRGGVIDSDGAVAGPTGNQNLVLGVDRYGLGGPLVDELLYTTRQVDPPNPGRFADDERLFVGREGGAADVEVRDDVSACELLGDILSLAWRCKQ